jgi:para-aminobenzoate synthetase/4-amino-4-deoxychorismate lyase
MNIEKNCVLFKKDKNLFYLFHDPAEIVRCRDENIYEKLLYIEEKTCEGFYAAGFVSYEGAGSFDPKFKVRKNQISESLWFGIYRKRDIINVSEFFEDKRTEWNPGWKIPLTYEEYEEKIEFIKNKIKNGDIYQLNFTFLMNSEISESPLDIFSSYFASLDSPYSAFIETDEFSVLSSSPELFFSLENDIITSKPMKGTIKRGLNLREDEINRKILSGSEKDQAENVMILDMMRNDCSKICDRTGVKAEKIFEIEKYSRVFQMTSTVKCRTESSVAEIFAALFPCASITGAPKMKAMEYIEQTEISERGVYTGVIGYIEPGRKALFNVAIRTLYIDKKKNLGYFGTGGGIVWDSEPELEFNECISKSLVVTDPEPDFKLLETMLYMPGKGFFLLDYHLKRIENSAKYFSFDFERKKLDLFFKDFSSANFIRLRLLLSRNSGFSFETSVLDENPLETNYKWRTGVEKLHLSSQNRFFYHKTTNRKVYDEVLSKFPECNDVILINERNEVTESCFANVVIEKKGVLYTPFLSSGLLPGTMRQFLVDKKKVREKNVYFEELFNCDKVFLVNSVRGFIEADIFGSGFKS